MKELLLYDSLSEFKRQFYKDLLGQEHVTSNEIKIDKVSYEDMDEDAAFNFWGWELKKDDTKYLLSCRNKQDKEIQLKKILPILPQQTQKVAHKGNVYRLIHSPKTVKFQQVNVLGLKKLVNILASFDHTNKDHQKLDIFLALVSYCDRAYFRKATPPGFGKDSIVDILGNLLGGCSTIENPTIAKLEERASLLKWLAVNEVIDISPGDWRKIEQILLAMGAFKPEVTKRSRAHGGVGETIDISDFSLTLMYNDITEYTDHNKYLDFISKGAVQDRFVPFRLWGTVDEDFNSYSSLNFEQYVKKNIKQFKDMIYTLTYYSSVIKRGSRRYNREKLIKLPNRWNTNVGKLLNVIDLYCDDQEEFNKWVGIINESIIDYKEMLMYPALYQSLVNRISKYYDQLKSKVVKDSIGYLDKLFVIDKQFKREINCINVEVKKINTFIDKNSFIKGYKIIEKEEKKTVYKDKQINEFWG